MFHKTTIFIILFTTTVLLLPALVAANSASMRQNLQGQKLLSVVENEMLLREDFFRYELKLSEEKIQLIASKQKQYLQKVVQFDREAAEGALDAVPSKFITIRNYQNWLRSYLGVANYELLLTLDPL